MSLLLLVLSTFVGRFASPGAGAAGWRSVLAAAAHPGAEADAEPRRAALPLGGGSRPQGRASRVLPRFLLVAGDGGPQSLSLIDQEGCKEERITDSCRRKHFTGKNIMVIDFQFSKQRMSIKGKRGHL